MMVIEVSCKVSSKMMSIIRNELYKVAAKAGGKYGKSPVDDPGGDIDNPREYWYGIVNRIHFAIDQLNHQQAQGSETLTLNFGDKDYDFEEFLKTELAAIANRLSKDAWGEYSPAMRREILEKGPYIVAQMRDQLCELRQPRLMVVEPVGVNVINL